MHFFASFYLTSKRNSDLGDASRPENWIATGRFQRTALV